MHVDIGTVWPMRHQIGGRWTSMDKCWESSSPGFGFGWDTGRVAGSCRGINPQYYICLDWGVTYEAATP